MQCPQDGPEEGIHFSMTVSTSTRAELHAHRKSRWSCPVERWGALRLSLCSYVPQFSQRSSTPSAVAIDSPSRFRRQLVTPPAKNPTKRLLLQLLSLACTAGFFSFHLIVKKTACKPSKYNLRLFTCFDLMCTLEL